ncbi:MAG: acetyl-CoA synthetase [Candidatus Tectimicrobiota bacterium]|nr:MAG: acetyl-CoA synthetase [Candidatus Tectomicrobia bacterium]
MQPAWPVPETFNAATYFVDRHLEEGRGEAVAIYFGDAQITYGEVARRVNQVGHALRRLGVRLEERVALLLLDGPEFVYSFFGAMKIGAVPLPLNTLLQPPSYAYILNDSRATVAIVSQELLPQLAPVRRALRYLKHLVVVGTAEAALSFWPWIEGEATALEAEPTSKDDMAFWLYSSGTTGMPKGVVHLHHDMSFALEHYARGVLGMHAGDRCFAIPKLFFAYGLGASLYFPFGVGASTVLYPGPFAPPTVFSLLQRYRPTLFFGVPTAYAALLAHHDAPEDLSFLRLCVSAGEALPPALYQRWRERFGVEILDGIGTTEAAHIFISNRPGRVKPGASGEVVPGYAARVVDDEGREVPPGEIGNLLIKGDSVAPFYWHQHDKSKQTFLGDWYATGDKYMRDEEGYFYYVGRADDLFKVGGQWFSPAEVEALVMEHPAVLECAIVGAQDADGLVKPRAHVVLKPGVNPSPELAQEIQEHVKQRVAPAYYKYPRWVVFASELPKTATGKIQRYKLRQEATA